MRISDIIGSERDLTLNLLIYSQVFSDSVNFLKWAEKLLDSESVSPGTANDIASECKRFLNIINDIESDPSEPRFPENLKKYLSNIYWEVITKHAANPE